jgi:hypothetical protein
MYTPAPIISHSADFSQMIPKVPPGPIAEFGVFEGGSTVQLAGYGRTVYAFDTFEGMPYDAPYDPWLDQDNPPGQFRSDHVIEHLAEYHNVICVKGTFQKTLPEFDPEVKFAFVYLDCDWYSSYRFVCEWLAKRMLPGAMALVDDYRYCAGCHKAIDEMVKEGIVTYLHPWMRWPEKQ